MIATDYIFGRKNVADEITILSKTFIEGVGTTNTPALLASKLGIQETAITEFIKEGNSITAIIGQQYTTPSLFPADALKDVDGQVGVIGNYLRGSIQVFYSPSAHTFSSRCFYGTGKLKYCVVPNIQTVASNPYGNFIFEIDPPTGVHNLNGLTVCFPASWATSNAGAMHPEAQYVVNNGGTVSFGDIENYQFLIQKPTKPRNVTVKNVTGTVVKFNFSVVASVNPVLRYEIYVNGVRFKNITSAGDFYIGFDQPLTNYTITIQAVDLYFNRSTLSDPVVVTTASEPYVGLNSVYQLQDSTPGVIVDSYSPGNGTIAGTYTLETLNGKVNPKAVYLGNQGSIKVPNKGIVRKASFNIWMRKEYNLNTALSGWVRFSRGVNAPQGHYRYSNNQIYCDAFSTGRKVIGTGNIADITANMHMVTVTSDQDTNVWKFYQNAVLVFTAQTGDLENYIWDIFEIGTSGLSITNPGGNLHWMGWAEQILFFHKALTQAEIDFWYNGGLGRVPVLT